VTINDDDDNNNNNNNNTNSLKPITTILQSRGITDNGFSLLFLLLSSAKTTAAFGIV
jgi:hypothetical protein